MKPSQFYDLVAAYFAARRRLKAERTDYWRKLCAKRRRKLEAELERIQRRKERALKLPYDL